ncbi:MAG: sensor histidine kinase N-terminal domain-containing protein [Pseudomonadota bacterium]|nr:sensor histidine kinase N-terminal domain-containing protein [Pseudomonadota bacterium]
MSESLSRQLLVWVLLPVGAAVAVQAEVSWHEADRTATVVQDRLLLGSARMIAEQLRYEEGELQHLIPPAALELFQSPEGDRVFYRLTTAAGVLLAGSDELPVPAGPLPGSGTGPFFYPTVVRSQPVHVAAMRHPVFGNAEEKVVTVQVAQTLHGHDALRLSLWRRSLSEQLSIFLLTALMVYLGLRHGLKPLVELRRLLVARPTGSLEPFTAARVPTELAPLLHALNDYIGRLQAHAKAQKTFIEDAAHQLRTPLTLLTTQIDLVSRGDEQRYGSATLAAAKKSLREANRILNQLLTLSSAQSQIDDRSSFRTVALDELLQQVVEDHAAQAYSKQIDLGFETDSSRPTLKAQPMMLRELASNLVDNAIRYTQEGGVVTVRVASVGNAVELTVDDNGPGIAAADRDRVFGRFVRLNERASSGSGLGLAIVLELARRNGGVVKLGPVPRGRGLRVAILFAVSGEACAAPETSTRAGSIRHQAA